ncbi:MAG: hypothetical protein H6739_19575 [Alphaproteobacteria bacterium]|nr:hypothetical protein [Alphaproteobacteria bacterium]
MQLTLVTVALDPETGVFPSAPLSAIPGRTPRPGLRAGAEANRPGDGLRVVVGPFAGPRA